MLTFSNPSFLWFLSGMAVPLCLHLLNLRETRRVVFPSIQFLMRSRQPQNGRRRLRDIVVMVLRMCAVGFGALLLSGPRWEPPEAFSGDLQKTAVFVLDVSSSMSWGKRLERGLACISQQRQELSGWRLGIVPTVEDELAMGGCVSVPPTLDYWRLDESLGGSRAAYCSGDVGAALKKAVGYLSGQRKKLIIVSDFQSTEWSRRISVVPSGVELELVDVTSAVEKGNCGILDVRCQRLGERRLRVIATVGCTSSVGQQCDLSIHVGGVLRREALTVPAHGRVRHAAVYDDVELGQPCRAQLSADSYPHDDVFVFWGDGAPPIPVVLAVNSDMDSVGAHEAQYVRAALESEPEGGAGRFSVELSDVSLLAPGVVDGVQAVFLLGGCDGIQADGIGCLHELLSRGGVVFATPGKNSGGDLRVLRELGLDFGRFQGVSGMSARSRADGVGRVREGSVLSPLYSKVEESDLYSFAIRRCVRVIPSSASIVHLWSLSELPLLLEYSCGRGRGYFMGFGFDGWWGDFQLTNSFLPMVHELLLHAVPSDFGRRKVMCGTRIFDRELGIQRMASEPQLYRNGGEYVEVNVSRGESVESYVGKLDVRDLLSISAGTGDVNGCGVSAGGIDLEAWLGWLLLAVCLVEMLVAMAGRFSAKVRP